MESPVTGRQRASRIPLDYFKTASLWERRKWTAAVVAAVAAVAWWTAGILLGHQNASFHSPGSLASVHHTWESQCAACHVDFHSIRDDAVAARWEGGTPASDEKCQACHLGAEHHPVKKGSLAPGCSSCHQDHQGLQASLVRMDDMACTRCHQAIAQHVDGKPALPPDSASVTRFDREHHPDFSTARKDPGHLKFSHHRHMSPGLVNDPREDKTVWTPARIPDPAQRERYRRPGQGDDSPVQLDCGSCHQLEGGDFISRPARLAGPTALLPITYENQCQACHPLYKAPGIVQHRQTPNEIHTALSRAFADDYLRGDSKLLDRPFVTPEPLPNARPADDETVARAIQGDIETAEKVLSQEYCGKCHVPAAAGPGLQPFLPTQSPQVWYDHAKFDHRAHRAMECGACHQDAADAQDPARDRTHTDMLIPQRDTCLQCHGPPSASGTMPVGGARFDCVECHRYHNGSVPLAGSGAKAGDPVRKLSLEEFQAGKTSD